MGLRKTRKKKIYNFDFIHKHLYHLWRRINPPVIGMAIVIAIRRYPQLMLGNPPRSMIISIPSEILNIARERMIEITIQKELLLLFPILIVPLVL